MSVSDDLPDDLNAAVLARPDDDAVRFACAEWYERHGQDKRGRFIRLQCESASLPPGDQRGWGLDNEANSLLWPNRNDWLGGRVVPQGVRWFFLRGFPEHVQFDSFKALEAARDAVFRHRVRRISFANLRSIARLARCDALALVRELNLCRCNLRDEGLATLAESPHLSGLSWLDLGGNGIRVDGIAALVESQTLTALTHLELNSQHHHSESNTLGAAGARLLAGWAGLGQLRYLGLTGCGVGDEGVAALAHSPHLTRLASICLANNDLSRAGLAALADAAAWPGLRLLRLTSNRVGDEGAGELARSRHWTRLETLEVNQSRVGDPGAAALAGAPQLASLRTLDLSHNAIGNAGAVALASSAHLSALTTLSLGANLIADEGGWALGRSPHLTALRTLTLGGNAIQRVLESAVTKRYSTQNAALLDAVQVRETPTAAAELEQPPPLPHAVGSVDEDGLWQAIVDDPDDDLPRLVYADWLDENDQPTRAELIRLQCDPARAGPSARENELIEQNRAAWLGPLGPFVQTARFERGLMRVVVNMRSFLTKAFQSVVPDALRQVRALGLELGGSTKDWSKFALSPVLASVHELWLAGSDVGRSALPALAKSPHLGGLHTLHVRDAYLSSNHLEALLQVECLPRLRRLTLDSAGVRLDHLQALARWPGASRLTTLSLRQNWLTPADASVLFTSPTFASLRVLGLYYNSVRDAGVRALAETEFLPALTHLDLSYCNVGNDGAKALADSPVLDRLRELRLENNSITADGALALASSPRLGRLRSLTLSLNTLPNECVEEMYRLMGKERVRSSRYRGG